MREGPIHVEWFKGGTTNIAYNALDRCGALLLLLYVYRVCCLLCACQSKQRDKVFFEEAFV